MARVVPIYKGDIDQHSQTIDQ